MRALLVFFAFILITSAASAFIGDDKATVASEYGQPVRHGRDPKSDAWIYRSVGYEILVEYRGGVSVEEAFFRLGADTAFSDALIRSFLQGHSGGKQWAEVLPVGGKRRWAREGETAFYDDSDPANTFLCIASEVEVPHMSNEPVSVPVVMPTPTPTPAAPSVVTVIQGTGDKTSDPFTIPAGAGFIVWFKSDKYLGLQVHRKWPSGERTTVAYATLKNGGTDHTFVDSPAGTYYVTFTAEGSFAASVTQ